MNFRDMAAGWRHSEEYSVAVAMELPKGFLGVNVFRLRAALDLTQEQLGQRVGMRQPRIAEIERGDANPRLETLAKLAYALETTVSQLVEDPNAAVITIDSANWVFAVNDHAYTQDYVAVWPSHEPVNWLKTDVRGTTTVGGSTFLDMDNIAATAA